MCLARDFPPPDPWQRFLHETAWPFVDLNVKVGLGLIALVAIAALIVGLFGDVRERERQLCGSIPMGVGVAAFLAVVAELGSRWWVYRSDLQTIVLAFAYTATALGLLVMRRSVFIREVAPLSPALSPLRRESEI